MTTDVFVATASGRLVSLLDPQPSDISIRDIAAGLAKTNRFCGATAVPYSVAQHSVLVSRIVERDPVTSFRTALGGLLHDAHEAYLGDVTRPMQRAMGQAAGMLAHLSHRMQSAICHALGLDPPDSEERAIITDADDVALATEWRDLMPASAWTPPSPPFPIAIKPLAWHRAEEEFLAAFERLSTLAGIRVPA